MIISYSMTISDALNSVHEAISKAAVKAGRHPDEIKLVTVSKTVELERIIEAVRAGACILGENRVQEARDKITDYKLQITNYDPEWHLIGTLQKNKSKQAVELFDLIHSVNDAPLAEELDKQANKCGKIQRVLVQVKLSDESTKHGIQEYGFMELLDRISEMDNLKLEGLMTLPPFFDDPEDARPYFRKLRALADAAAQKGHPVRELSMGMSHDFEVAIEEGATMVRIGSAIFGERHY